MNRVLLAIIGCVLATTAWGQGWGGGYIGASLGRIKAKSTWTTTQLGEGVTQFCPPNCISSLDGDLGASGWHWAAHAGYNWTFGPALLGVEGSVGNANAKGTIDHVPGYLDDGMQRDRIVATYEWDGSIVGRIGFAAGPVLLYGLAGPSWQKRSIRFSCPGDPIGANSYCISGSYEENRADVLSGWTAGGGAEFRLHRRWTARLDYRYAKYKDKDYIYFRNTPAGVDSVFATVTLKTSVVHLGVSYRF